MQPLDSLPALPFIGLMVALRDPADASVRRRQFAAAERRISAVKMVLPENPV